eukprot:2297642-Alexandrium_andersonii.AAC.1
MALATALPVNVDPEGHVLVARALAWRRAWFLTPWARDAMADAMASILVPKCGPQVAQESCHELIRQAMQGEIERGEYHQQQGGLRVGPL